MRGILGGETGIRSGEAQWRSGGPPTEPLSVGGALGFPDCDRACHLPEQPPAVSLGRTAAAPDFPKARAAAYLLLGNRPGFAPAAHLVKGLSMNTKYRVDRRKALGVLGGAVSLVAVPGARAFAQSLDKVSYQTNWRAQAEHG